VISVLLFNNQVWCEFLMNKNNNTYRKYKIIWSCIF